MKDPQREARACSRAVAAAQHAQSKSAASRKSLKEQDMPQIGSRPRRSQKSCGSGAISCTATAKELSSAGARGACISQVLASASIQQAQHG